MSCQSSLSSVALMSWVGLTLSSKHVHRLSKYFCLCRPLARLHSTFPVTTSAFSWHVQRNQAAFAWSSSLTYVELLQLSVLPDYSFTPSTKFSASFSKTTFPLPWVSLSLFLRLSTFHIHMTRLTMHNSITHVTLSLIWFPDSVTPFRIAEDCFSSSNSLLYIITSVSHHLLPHCPGMKKTLVYLLNVCRWRKLCTSLVPCTGQRLQ